MSVTRNWPWWAAVAVLGFAACSGPSSQLEPEDQQELQQGKFEAWNAANNPAYVDNTFIYDVGTLPVQGQVQTAPVPAYYWPTAGDSLNYRWDGSNLSPAEKTQQAFGLSGFTSSITQQFGVYSGNRPACNADTDCASLGDGSYCVAPRGASGGQSGRCIPGWWGICHGWAPFANREPAPINPVVKNGVTFYPGDLEGLMSLAYTQNLPIKFLASRCNTNAPNVDANGRVIAGECRDINAGSFYVVATNMIGMRHVGYVEDRTYDVQVWNQPVRSYTVTNAQNGHLLEVTKQQAISLLGLDLHFTPLITQNSVLQKDQTRTGVFTAPSSGTVTISMTGTGDADLYVKKNSPVSESSFDCRPYTGNSDERCTGSVNAGDQLYWMIKGAVASSTVNLAAGTQDGQSNYVYNTQAVRFFHVEMDFNYVAEAQPARTSHLSTVDQYTLTDHYSFVLETDQNGSVLGGEWIGEANTDHPDFVWWPTGAPQGVLPGGLTYNQLKALNDQAAGMPDDGNGGGNGGGGGNGSVLYDYHLMNNQTITWRSHYFGIGVPPNDKLTVTMTGNGQADLYLRSGFKPSIWNFGCHAGGPGSNKTCTMTAPGSGATIYLRVRPVASSSTVTVEAQVTRP